MQQPGVHEGGIELGELARAVVRRWWVIGFLAVVCSVAAFVASRLSPKTYRASATIRISPEVQRGVTIANPWLEGESLATEVQILQSRTIAERVLAGLGPAASVGQAPVRALNARDIQGALTVSLVRDTAIVKLTMEYTDPETAMAVVNGVAKAYLEYSLEQMHSEARSVREFLEGQLTEIRSRLDAAQKALAEYQRKEGIVYLRAGVTSGGGSDFSLTTVAASVAGLRGKLTDLQVQRMSAARRVAATHPELRRLDDELSSVRARLAAETARLNELQDKQYRLTQLDQDVRIEEMTYSELLSRFNQARVAESVDVGNVRIVDLARTTGPPVKPRTKSNTILGFLLGLAIGLAAALVLDRLQDVIRDPAEAERVSGLPVLGFVPRLAIMKLPATEVADSAGISPGVLSGELVAQGEGRSVASEAFRTLRTALRYVRPEKPIKTIVVTSGSPGEGKTTVAANLAISLASGGAKVVLVDADMRKASLHKLIGMPKEPGLSEVLATGRAWLDAARTTTFPNLALLSAGKAPPNPADLLDSARMREVMQSLAAEYDFVVVDSPPVGLVTDAQVLAAMSDATILVVRAGRSHRGVVRGARDLLGRVGAHTAGAVLNDITPRAGYYYGGYGYYRYGYGYGYGQGSGYYGEREEQGAKKESDKPRA